MKPAPADVGHKGTDLNAETRRYNGIGEDGGEGTPGPVFDAQRAPVTPNWMLPPDRRHAVKALYDGMSHKTWEQLQVEKFIRRNCDRMSPKVLRLAVKNLAEYSVESLYNHRARVRNRMRVLDR